MFTYGVFLISLSIVPCLAIPSSLEADSSLSENLDSSVNERALPSLILPSNSSISASSGQSPDNAPLKDYSVFPVKPNKIDEVFRNIITFASGNVHTQRSPNRPETKGVLYWSFKISDSNAVRLREALGLDATLVETKPAGRRQEEFYTKNASSPFVVPLNITDKVKPINALFPQRDASPDLKVVSWPPPPPVRTLGSLRNYVYNNDWRKDPTIYIIDSGVNPMNRDFRGRINKWLYSPRANSMGIATETDSDDALHGSCVASKAVGLVNGVYKRSNLVVVKLDPDIPIEEIVWAFDEIVTEMVNGDPAKPAVIIFPILSPDNPSPQEWDQVRIPMQQIINRGGSIVVPSGNFRDGSQRQNVDLLPALWASDTFPIIVAGAVDNTGAQYAGSQGGPRVTTWAPGVQVRCAGRLYASKRGTGTSVAAGMVSGLVASALALEQVVFSPDINTPRDVRAWLINSARWNRRANGPPVIWNEVQGY